MTLVINSYSDLSNIFVILMVCSIQKMFSKSAPRKFKGVTMGRDFGDDRKNWYFFTFFARNVKWVQFSNLLT